MLVGFKVFGNTLVLQDFLIECICKRCDFVSHLNERFVELVTQFKLVIDASTLHM